MTRGKIILSLTFALLALSFGVYHYRDSIITHYYDYQQSKRRRAVGRYPEYQSNGITYYLTDLIPSEDTPEIPETPETEDTHTMPTLPPFANPDHVNPVWVFAFDVTVPGSTDSHLLADIFRGFAGPKRDFHVNDTIKPPTIEDLLIQGGISYDPFLNVNINFVYDHAKIITVTGDYPVTTNLRDLLLIQ